ncbi:MAG: hypothetical protein AAF456_09935 [Planctomycetota bacterium]
MKKYRSPIIVSTCLLLLLVAGLVVRGVGVDEEHAGFSDVQPSTVQTVPQSASPQASDAPAEFAAAARAPEAAAEIATRARPQTPEMLPEPARAEPFVASSIPVVADRSVQRAAQVPVHTEMAAFEITRLPEFSARVDENLNAGQFAAGYSTTSVAPAFFEGGANGALEAGATAADETDIFVDSAPMVAQRTEDARSVLRSGTNSVPGRPASFSRQPQPLVPGSTPPAGTVLAPEPPAVEPLPEPAPVNPEPTPGETDEEQEMINDPIGALNAGSYRLATQPRIGDHYKDDTPLTDENAWLVDYQENDFAPTPTNPNLPYDAWSQMQVYEGKSLNANQRPLIELGKPWYQLGQFAPPSTVFGEHNPVSPQFLIFGDFRTAFATNDLNGDDTTQLAWQLNMVWNLHLTATERVVTFMNPLGFADNTRLIFDNGGDFREEFDADFDFGYLEGDLGAITGGFTGETLPFDLPFAVGVMPLLVQNGIWLEDAFLGAAFTIPARNSPRLDISNMDFTFFAGFDEIDSPAFEGDDDVAKMWGMLSFIEAMNGYWEIDYAFLEDRSFRDRSYHNIGIGFSRRYGRFISNSTRVIVNAGQSSDVGPNTADGVLLLSENSLISGFPSTIVPYFNMFAGFDRPQSAARAGAAGGILRNTGILFESDNLTGYPTLDDTANDTFGAALGINIMPDDLTQQLVLEVAALGVHGSDVGRNAAGNQFGAGFRYQLPLTNALILRSDGMFGWLDNENDIHGFRVEMRRKF